VTVSTASHHLVIVGASARAAAFSALRAGLRPWCADLFADADLESVCPALRLPEHRYPAGLPHLLKQAPPGPWMYAGGMENWPRVVRQIAKSRPLWGNDRDVLRQVRQPWRMADTLNRAGLPCPEFRRVTKRPPRDGHWLLKRLESAGGRGVELWLPKTRCSSRAKVYFQQYIEGDSCAAIYVGDGRTAHLLGVTRQLVGEAWLHAEPFHYCGSVGPLSLTPKKRRTFVQIGEVLASEFGLRGLFGVDFVVRDGKPYPIEINPRYTASVEVLEHALAINAIGLHRAVFEGSQLKDNFTNTPVNIHVGKVILFARDTLIVPADAPWNAALDQSVMQMRDFSDVPHPGRHIEKGRPIVSLFARGRSNGRCLQMLHQRTEKLDRWLFGK